MNSTESVTVVSNISGLSTASTNITSYVINKKYRSYFCNKSLISPQEELQNFSDERAFLYLPVIVFVAIIMILGIVGNMIVIYIYISEYKRKPSNSFIIAMAIFDFLASIISMPMDIYDMVHHYTFYNQYSCKIFRFFESAFTHASTIILIHIAIDRFLKICVPLLPESSRRCKIMCASALVGGILMAIPTLWLFGINLVIVPRKKYCGHDCSVSFKYYGTPFQKNYFAALLGMFFVTTLILIIFYVIIWVAIKNRRHSVIGDRASVSKSSVKSNDSKEGNAVFKRSRILSSTSEDDSVFLKTDGKAMLQRQQSSASRKSRMSRMSSVTTIMAGVRCTRTTKIFIVISAAFIISFLPSITVNLLRSYVKSIQRTKSKAVKVTIKLFARFHFINHAVNPFIYSFLNINFRNQCKSAFKRVSVMCTTKFSGFKRGASISSRSSRSSKKHKISKSDSDAKTNEIDVERFNTAVTENKIPSTS